MAIGFARISIHTRSQGHSAVRGAAYRSGQKLFDSRTGVSEDFTKRQDVLHTDIMLPEGANQQFKDREVLWNAVEACEKRKDSQVAKDCILALPKELGFEKQVQLARNFAHYHFVSKGLVADVAVHAPHEGGNNTHAHIYITTRRLIGDRFDQKKARDLNPGFANGAGKQGFVSEQSHWNHEWRKFQNDFFTRHDIDLVVDEDHLISQCHEGRVNANEAHYLKAENALNREIESLIAITEPEAVLNELSSRYAVFTERNIQSILFKSTDSIECYQAAYAGLKAHADLIELDVNESGQTCYTTRATYTREAELADNARALAKRMHAPTPPHRAERISTRMGLNQDQASALQYLAGNRALSAIVGRAGTGKSYLMQAANTLWSGAGFNVIGLAPSGIAAKGLETASTIPSMTIASFKLRKIELGKQDIVVMDEAGMVDLYDMAEVVKTVKAAGAKLVVLGDPAQLQPIGPGAPFRAITESVGFVELSSIRRQSNEKDRQATHQCATGDIFSALKHYRMQGDITLSKRDAISDLILAWGDNLTKLSLSDCIILAHQRNHVAELNRQAREKLHSVYMLNTNESIEFDAEKGKISISVGEKIIFLRNDKHLDIRNGEFAVVESIKNNKLQVKLGSRTLTLDSRQYNHIDYGYATTVHKAQGLTKDKIFVYVSGFGWNRHLTYVALSRHKETMQLFAPLHEFKSLSKLATSLSRDGLKDNAIDWPLRFSQRRGLKLDSIKNWVANNAACKIKNIWTFLTNYQNYTEQFQHSMEDKTAKILFSHYIDQQTVVAQMCRKLSQSMPATQKLYDHKDYLLFLKEKIKRDELAFRVQEEWKKNKSLFQSGAIQPRVIFKQSSDYLRYRRVLYYKDLCGKNDKLAAKLAGKIVDNFNKHYSYLVCEGVSQKDLQQFSYPRNNHLFNQLDGSILYHQKTQAERDVDINYLSFKKLQNQYMEIGDRAEKHVAYKKLLHIAHKIKMKEQKHKVKLAVDESEAHQIRSLAALYQKLIAKSRGRSR